jgi:hypothetical protein
MTYHTDDRYPDPIATGLKLLATGRNFDYFLNGDRVFSYGKTARGTRTTAFGGVTYWRHILTSNGFRSGIKLVSDPSGA